VKQHRLICGLLVLVSPDVPKLQLSDDVPVTPAFRAEMNDWMRSFFGVTNLVQDDQVFVVGDKMHVNPRMYARLQRAVP